MILAAAVSRLVRREGSTYRSLTPWIVGVKGDDGTTLQPAPARRLPALQTFRWAGGSPVSRAARRGLAHRSHGSVRRRRPGRHPGPFRGYANALHDEPAGATPILDAFHFAKLAEQALGEARRRVQQDTSGARCPAPPDPQVACAPARTT